MGTMVVRRRLYMWGKLELLYIGKPNRSVTLIARPAPAVARIIVMRPVVKVTLWGLAGIKGELGFSTEGGMLYEIVGSSSLLIGYGDMLLLKELGRENLNFWIIKRQETFVWGKLLRITTPLKKHMRIIQVPMKILVPLSTQDLSSGQKDLIWHVRAMTTADEEVMKTDSHRKSLPILMWGNLK